MFYLSARIWRVTTNVCFRWIESGEQRELACEPKMLRLPLFVVTPVFATPCYLNAGTGYHSLDLFVSANTKSFTYFSFCAKSEIVVAVPVYSRKKRQSVRLVTYDRTREPSFHKREGVFAANHTTQIHPIKGALFSKFTWIDSLDESGIVNISSNWIFELLAEKLCKTKQTLSWISK